MSVLVGGFVVSVVSAIVGAAITFVTARWLADRSFKRDQETIRQHEEQQRHEQQQRVRHLLQLENSHNLRAFEVFWNDITTDLPAERSPLDAYFEESLRLAEVPMFEWGHRFWNAHISQLLGAFNDEEIRQLYELHTLLDQFSAFRTEFQRELSSEPGRSMGETYRQNRDLLRIGTNPEVPGDTTYRSAFELARWVEAYKKQTLGRLNQCQAIWNAVNTLTNVLSTPLPTKLPVPKTPEGTKRPFWRRLFMRLHNVHEIRSRHP